MSQDKILIRSKTIEIIYDLKKTDCLTDRNLFKACCLLKKLKDDEFVIATILKEINFQNPKFDVALVHISKMLSLEITKEQTQKLLEKPNVADKKKLFLMNVLRELGENISFEDTVKYLNEPENIDLAENELMVRLVGVNPEAQIDFLDFFFTISDENKIHLLNSLTEDTKGEELVNALEPIVYYDQNAPYIEKIIEILRSTKCHNSKLLLEFISKSNSEFANIANSAKNELILAGFRSNKTKKEVIKEYLKNTIPLGFWASLVDGVDNFSIIFARQKADGNIATFFNVLNLKTGIVSTFGFDDISIEELKTILKRFFKSSYMVELKEEIGIKILSEFEKLSIKKKRKIPYEYLAWKNYLEDIKIPNIKLEEEFKKELEVIYINDEIYEAVFGGDVLNSWFITPEDSEEFGKLTEKITSKIDIQIEEIEEIIKKNADKIIKDKDLTRKILFECYFLTQIEFTQRADVLYSISNSEKYLKRFKEDMLKISLYQYFLRLKDEKNKVKSIFEKSKKKVDYKYFIKMLEDKWSK